MYYINFVYGANFIIFVQYIKCSMSRPKKDITKVLGGVVLVRLNAREVEGIEAIAKRNTTNKSVVVRAAIDYLLDSCNIKTKNKHVRTKRHNSRSNEESESQY